MTPEEYGLGCFLFDEPIGAKAEQRSEACIGWKQGHVDVVLAQGFGPVRLPIQQAVITLGKFFPERSLATIDKDTLARIKPKGEIVGPGIAGKKLRAWEIFARMTIDQVQGKAGGREIRGPGQTEQGKAS